METTCADVVVHDQTHQPTTELAAAESLISGRIVTHSRAKLSHRCKTWPGRGSEDMFQHELQHTPAILTQLPTTYKNRSETDGDRESIL